MISRFSFFLTSLLCAMCLLAAEAQEPKKNPSVPVAPSPDEIDEYFTKVAADLTKFLKGQREVSVAINISPRAGSSTAGAGYAQILSDKLQAAGIATPATAKFTFRGTFGLSEKGGGDLGLAGEIVDVFGKPAVNLDFTGTVRDPRQVAPGIGINVSDLHRAGDPDAARDAIRIALEKPDFFLREGTEASAKKGSPFALRVRLGEEPVAMKKQNGSALVELPRKREYVLELLNYSKNEAAVSISIDGLDTFYYCKQVNPETKRPYRYYIVPPAKGSVPGSVPVEGWFRPASNAGVTQAFQTVPLAESLAAKLGNPSGVGQITVVFHASWQEDSKTGSPNGNNRPDDEAGVQVTQLIPRINTKRVVVDGKEYFQTETAMATIIGTSFGSDRIENSKGVARVIGKVRDSITIRYVGKE